MGSRELTVKVGGTVVGERLSDPVARISSEPVRQHPIRGNNTLVGSDPFQAAARSRSGTPVQYGPVESGETLSGIAQEYLIDGVTMNQMMIALFNTNPQAFDGNINVLYEGAMLRIPDGDELHDQAHETATAQVAQHTDAWRNAHKQRANLATVASERRYGPVDSGETLSGIAKTILHNGITMNQMMIALFQANPQAFSGNINVLHSGAILRIPNADELRRQNSETARAEVVRHAQTWQLGDGQHAQSTMAHADMAASL
jgi:FimV-like protein